LTVMRVGRRLVPLLLRVVARNHGRRTVTWEQWPQWHDERGAQEGMREIASQSLLPKISRGERRMERMIANCDGWRRDCWLRFDLCFFIFS
jgi:hypothetical protein